MKYRQAHGVVKYLKLKQSDLSIKLKELAY